MLTAVHEPSLLDRLVISKQNMEAFTKTPLFPMSKAKAISSVYVIFFCVTQKKKRHFFCAGV